MARNKNGIGHILKVTVPHFLLDTVYFRNQKGKKKPHFFQYASLLTILLIFSGRGQVQH